MFTGREYFPELGLYDYRNRFYYPALGRFLQSDPIGFDADGVNIFRYCSGDPVNGSDPLGLDAVTERVIVTGAPVPVDYDYDDRPIYDDRWSVFDPLNDYLDSLFNDDRARVDYVRAPVEPLPQPGANFSLGPALPPSPSAPSTLLVRNLQLNLNARSSRLGPGEVFITHYGYSRDRYRDTNSNVLRLGNHRNTLNANSLSLTVPFARAYGLSVGDPVRQRAALR